MMQKQNLFATAAVAAMVAFGAGCDKPEAPQGETPAAETPVAETAAADDAAQAALDAPAAQPGIASDIVATPPPPKDTDVIASVGDATLTWGELNKRVDAEIEAYRKVAGSMFPSEQLPAFKQEARAQTVQRFIFTALIKNAAAKAGVTVDDAYRAEKIKEVEAQPAAQGKTFDELAKTSPLGEARMRELFEESLLAERLFEAEVFPKATVSDEEIQTELAKNTAERKLVEDALAGYQKQLADGSATFEALVQANSVMKSPMSVPVAELTQGLPPEEAKAFQAAIDATAEGGVTAPVELPGVEAIFKVIRKIPDDAAAKAKAEALRARIEKGEDFAAVAREASDCPSGERGGDLGEFGKGRMDPVFEQAAFTQKVGELGPLVKSSFGYHIIKVTARDDKAGTAQASHILVRPATVRLLPLAMRKPGALDAEELRAMLTDQRRRLAVRDYIEAQRTEQGVTCSLFPELAAPAPKAPQAPAPAEAAAPAPEAAAPEAAPAGK